MLRTWSALWPERERRADEEAADRSAEAGVGARQQREEEDAAVVDAAAADVVGFNIVVRMCFSSFPDSRSWSVFAERRQRGL